MSIKLGIYDFFSYFVPGGIITAAFFFVLNKHLEFAIDCGSLSIIEFLGLGTLAYLVGFAADSISRKTWYRLFYRNDLFEVTISKFNKRHPSFEVLFQEIDWYIAFSFIKKQNLDVAQDIDKFNVTSIMLRNSSLGLLLFAIIFIVEFFLDGYLSVDAIFGVSCLAIAIILVRESVKFKAWFYQSILQSLVGLLAKPEQMPVKFEVKPKRSKQNGD